MKHPLVSPWSRPAALLAAMACLASTAPAEDAPSVPVPSPSAQEILDAVVAQLPHEPLTIQGDIVVRKRHGIVLNDLRYRMELRWGEEPATATYTILDRLGQELESLTITRTGGRSVFRRRAGNPPVDAPLADPSFALQETDLSWMDLTLSFLWWRGGRITGEESIRGRHCTVIEVPSPEVAKGQYAAVRLWIDDRVHLLLQAEGLDADGKRVRVLWIKSLKKINDRWMIKDVEVQSHPLHRTKLVVRDVNGKPAGPADEGQEDETETLVPRPVVL